MRAGRLALGAHLSEPARVALAGLQRPSAGRSLGQAASALLPFLALVGAMYWTAGRSVPATLGLGMVAAGFVLRIFSIQHDCGHGAYFRSKLANAVMGGVCSAVTLTPFASWRRAHAEHHARSNNLDRRDRVDPWSNCLTVAEYRALSRLRQLGYRALHHPVVEIVLLPPLVFLLLFRFPFDVPRSCRMEWASIHATNAMLAVLGGGLVWLAGWQAVVLVHVPYVVAASIVGGWLFTVQHRFEESLWLPGAAWTRVGVALGGASHLQLPRALEWVVGNTTYHNVHHLLPRVPNYRLAECHALLRQAAVPMTALRLRDALRAPFYALWDEESGRMVRYPGRGC